VLIFFIVCAYPEFADSIRNIVAAKGLHLHEHEFRPERWPRMKTDKGITGNEYSAENEKTIGYEYRAEDEKNTGNEYSAGNDKTIGYEYQAADEEIIGYRYAAN
jgi:hypothetical protein